MAKVGLRQLGLKFGLRKRLASFNRNFQCTQCVENKSGQLSIKKTQTQDKLLLRQLNYKSTQY